MNRDEIRDLPVGAVIVQHGRLYRYKTWGTEPTYGLSGKTQTVVTLADAEGNERTVLARRLDARQVIDKYPSCSLAEYESFLRAWSQAKREAAQREQDARKEVAQAVVAYLTTLDVEARATYSDKIEVDAQALYDLLIGPG